MTLLETRACILAGFLVTAIYSATSWFPPSRACMTSDAQRWPGNFSTTLVGLLDRFLKSQRLSPLEHIMERAWSSTPCTCSGAVPTVQFAENQECRCLLQADHCKGLPSPRGPGATFEGLASASEWKSSASDAEDTDRSHAQQGWILT
mmetsp:Transcript_63687/g.122437  ORF Transcript_63687/g.122437 Transcript_63687/m.122437 type:complete len:148 (+) Transcript_63687:664-1107(+)